MRSQAETDASCLEKRSLPAQEISQSDSRGEAENLASAHGRVNPPWIREGRYIHLPKLRQD